MHAFHCIIPPYRLVMPFRSHIIFGLTDMLHSKHWPNTNALRQKGMNPHNMGTFAILTDT